MAKVGLLAAICQQRIIGLRSPFRAAIPLISLSPSLTTTDSEGVVCHFPAAKGRDLVEQKRSGARSGMPVSKGQGAAAARGKGHLRAAPRESGSLPRLRRHLALSAEVSTGPASPADRAVPRYLGDAAWKAAVLLPAYARHFHDGAAARTNDVKTDTRIGRQQRRKL